MSITELKAALEAAGWRISAIEPHYGSNWYAWLPRDARATKSACACNDKPPSFCIEPSSFDYSGVKHSSATFRLCGELPNGHWVDLRVYSVPVSEVMAAVEPAKAALFAAWEASVAATQTKEGPT